MNLMRVLGLFALLLLVGCLAASSADAAGYTFCTDQQGNYVVDADGRYVLIDAGGTLFVLNHLRVAFYSQQWRAWYEGQRQYRAAPRQYGNGNSNGGYQRQRSYSY